MFSRARRLSSPSMMNQGDSGMSVCTSISSLAREYSSHRVIDSRSIGESFHWRMGSRRRDANRLSCSASLTLNQYLRRMMPSSMRRRSKMGVWCRKRRYSSGVQKPMTFSTPARLYQERSKSRISPAAGNSDT